MRPQISADAYPLQWTLLLLVGRFPESLSRCSEFQNPRGSWDAGVHSGCGRPGTHGLNPCDRSGRRVAELNHGNGCRRASCQQPAPSRLRKETCSEAALPRGETEARTGRSARGPRGPDSAGTPAGWPRAACGSLPPAPKCAMLPLTRPRSAHEPGGRCAVTGRSLADGGPVNAGTVTLSRSWHRLVASS